LKANKRKKNKKHCQLERVKGELWGIEGSLNYKEQGMHLILQIQNKNNSGKQQELGGGGSLEEVGG